MFCRICGASIPDDSVFCPSCGREVITCPDAAPVPEDIHVAQPGKAFTFAPDTTYDQASVPVNAWLAQQHICITAARFVLDAVMLAGTMVPTVSAIELDFEPQPDGQVYQLGVMIDPRPGLGFGKPKPSKTLSRQFDRWQKEHPEFEVAGRQESPLTLGWSSAWVVCFFYR